MYYIYKITNTLNSKTYIGKRKFKDNQDPLSDNYWGSGVLLKRSYDKYGRDNFTKEILESNLTEQEATLKEIQYIRRNKEQGKAEYNISPGGEGITIDYAKLSPEELTQYLDQRSEFISRRIKDYWDNLSPKEYEARCNTMKDGWAQQTQEQRQLFSKKRSNIQREVYNNTSQDQRDLMHNKTSQSLKLTRASKNRQQLHNESLNISKGLKEYYANLSSEDRDKLRLEHSKSQRDYLKRESKEHREIRLKRSALSRSYDWVIEDPGGQVINIRGLSTWCKEIFGDKANSACTTLKQRGKYRGYKLIERIPL